MLLGKTIIVTGAASGIGARTAEMIGQLGADVIGVDVRPSLDAHLPCLRADLSSPASIEAVVAQLPGRVDALCNVAGVSGSPGAVKSLEINFYGLRALSEALAPRLREGGAIVNVASIAGYGWRQNLARARSLVDEPGFPDVAAVVARLGIRDEEVYPVTKEALLLWTYRAAHSALFKARGIRVNAVSPGPVETPILQEFRAVLGDARVDRDIAAVGRAGTAHDIAPLMAFLCSDGARWINGANVPVDGGLQAAVHAEALGF
jgi:NAD(P)-dependent dehydrogenase (short-subunit alcohol dehydrogenase family)